MEEINIRTNKNVFVMSEIKLGENFGLKNKIKYSILSAAHLYLALFDSDVNLLYSFQ